MPFHGRTKVLMLHDYPPITGGGLALSVRELSSNLRNDFQCLVLTSRLADHFSDDRRKETSPSPTNSDDSRYSVGTLSKIARGLIDAEILIVHWTFSIRRLSTFGLLIGPLMRKPTVCVIHTAPDHCNFNRLRHLPDQGRRILFFLMRITMRRCTAVVALSQSHSKELSRVSIQSSHVFPLPVASNPRLRQCVPPAKTRESGPGSTWHCW